MKVVLLCCFLSSNVWARSDPKAFCRQGPFIRGSVQRRWMYNLETDDCDEFLYSDKENLSENTYESFESCVNRCQIQPRPKKSECAWLNWDHYEALNCIPKYKSKHRPEVYQSACPFAFHCPSFEANVISKVQQCKYKGKYYQLGDPVPAVSEDYPCKQSCECSEAQDTKLGKIVCANVECPEGLNPKPNCKYTYTSGQCCSTASICDEKGTTDYICEYKGQKYIAGEQIYDVFNHQGKWKENCICDSDFKGPGSPSCERIKCGFFVDHVNELEEGCVPVYPSEGSACPLQLMCPDDLSGRLGPKIAPITNQANEAEKLQCHFGTYTLDISQTYIQDNQPTFDCSCRIPPFISCFHRPELDKDSEAEVDLLGRDSIDKRAGCAACDWLIWTHYEALNCTPNIEDGDCCPTSFTCPPPPEPNIGEQQCIFQGIRYEVGEEIDVSEMFPCKTNCRCTELDGMDFGKISCIDIECPEVFQEYDPDCVYTYEKGNCCSKGKKCGIQSSDYTCEYNGQKFVEGQRITLITERNEETCICDSTFTGPGSPTCEKRKCGLECFYRHHFERGCVPVYYNKNISCPIDWLCPGSKGAPGPRSTSQSQSSTQECRFDGHTLKIYQRWDSFDDESLDCECLTPPMLTCLKRGANNIARDDIAPEVYDNEKKCECNWLNWSHYRYMKCSPNFEKGECCPSSFTCPELPPQSKSECFYNGKTYQQGDEIPDVFKKHPCSRDCRCVYGHINCANVECPRLFNPESPNPGCVDTYEKYDCCPSETKCNIRDSDYICEHEGKRYVQGQNIEVQSERFTEVCICEPGFSGAGSPSCREIDCGYDLRYRKRLSEGCVPVFYSVNSSCPIEWMCPGSGGHAGPIPENAASDKQCRFGEDTLEISQTWISEDPCLNCECQTPPMLTCLREQCPSPNANCKYLGHVEGQCCHKYNCPDE